MMQRLMVACCCLVIFASCTYTATPEPFSEERAINPGPSVEHRRSRYLAEVFHLYPQVKLPFHRATEGPDYATHPEAGKETDTLLFGEHLPVYIVGTLPDTSSYFGILYLVPADEACLAFAAFDKSGRVVGRTILVNYTCGKGGECDSESFIDISKDLTITFDYSEYLYDYESEDNWHVPNAASGYVRTSKITSSGKIKALKRTEKAPALLLQHPILH
jgi:hypothetical protein